MTDKVLKSLNIGDGNIYKPLPLVTSDDNGKILKVTGGEWGAGEVFPVTLISFTVSCYIDTPIDDDLSVTYQAKEGMTWEEWIGSEYCTDSSFTFVISADSTAVGVSFTHPGTSRTFQGSLLNNSTDISKTDIITESTYNGTLFLIA